jgi:hypothetical protein
MLALANCVSSASAAYVVCCTQVSPAMRPNAARAASSPLSLDPRAQHPHQMQLQQQMRPQSSTSAPRQVAKPGAKSRG